MIGAVGCAIARWVSRTWQEIRVEVGSEFADLVANFLHESGAPGTILEAHDDRVVVTGHFAAPISTDPLAAYCASLGAPFSLTQAQIAEENWAENWKEYFPPVEIGERILIVPPWDRTPSAGRERIVIDPGMAFGTGHHATTSGCLGQIERECLARPLASVLDYGCGSGILAIAALRLGARQAYAVDIDPEACAAAEANATLNGVRNEISVMNGSATPLHSFGLIAANLFADLLVEKIPQFWLLLEPGGLLVCAGLLVADEARVSAAASKTGLQMEYRTCVDSWVVQSWRRMG